MKFGNLYWQNTSMKESEFRAINIGDNLQFMAIDYLYSRFLPDIDKIVRLQMNELKYYQGETLVLPLNWALFDAHFMNGDKIAISDYIVPVYLGMTIESIYYKEDYFNEYNIAYLRRFEPIGCRDQHTVDVLSKYGIRAYLNGCMTSIFPKRRKGKYNKVFFVDAPISLQNYIPNVIKQNFEVVTQQYYFENDMDIKSILNIIKAQYHKYANEAGMVVTSRLHVASPCLAMGIPVILVKDQVDGRFGWIDKYIPLYEKEHYDRINWFPQVVEYEDIKELIIKNAVGKIKGIYESYLMTDTVNKVYESREEKKYINFQQTIYNNFERAVSYLHDNHNVSDRFVYSIWGINAAADAFYKYMNTEYPNAKLKDVIDTYKDTEFYGIHTIKPDDFNRLDEEIVFVLPVSASNEVGKIIKKGIEERYYVCCGNQFITTDALNICGGGGIKM